MVTMQNIKLYIRRYRMSKKINEVGNRYGKLTVLSQIVEPEIKKQHNGAACWKCQCECGRIIITTGHELRRGRRKTCGNKECSNLVINEVGKRYGKLTIVKYAGLNKTGQALWECQCDCGNKIIALGTNLRRGNTKSCGCLKSQGELKIGKILLENNIPFEKEKKFRNCRFPKTDFPAKFDFYVNNKYIIEYDGIQHSNYFDYQSSWNTKENLKITQERDSFKNNWCKQNNIPLIRIPYTQLDNLCIEDLLLESSNFIIS